jgi:type I restriction enzyme S subunit
MPAKALLKKPTYTDKVAKVNAEQLNNEPVITQALQNNEGLPNSWKWIRLGDLCEVVTGTTPPKADSKNYGNAVPFFKPPHLWDGQIYDTDEKLSLKGAENARVVPANTVLVTCIGNLGRTGFVKKKAAFNQQINAILENESIEGKYIFYQAQSPLFKKQLERLATGTTVSIVNKGNFETIEIPLSPKDQQQTIVSKIEELFSELDKGKQQLETAQQQLKIYKQAVLKWAFEGKLTNRNVKDGELPEGWKWVKTIDVIDTINNGYTPTKEFLTQDNGEIPFLKVYNLNFDGTVNFKKNPTFIPNAVHKKDLKRSICYPGDVLINIVGPPLGKVSVVSNQFPEWNINQAIVMFRPNERVTSKYLSYFLQNKVTINWLENTSKATAGQWNIKVSTCREIPFPHCSINEQDLVIQEIESRLSVCDEVEETITASLAQAETLRQSILKKAFEGKLITQAEFDNVRTLSQPLSVTEDLSIAAEPTAEYRRKNKQIQVPFPRVIEGISTTDLHAGVLAMVIDAHEKSKEHGMNLSHVKGEKIAHLVEAHIGIDLGRIPQKDAAGPDDFPHLKKVESRAIKSNWFGVKKLQIGQTYFSKSGMPRIIQKLKASLSEEDFKKIETLVHTFLPFELEHAEVIATVYAGWNNLLLEGKTPTDEEIVYESRENWSSRKLGIDRASFFKALKWMRKHGYEATGIGKRVTTRISD